MVTEKATAEEIVQETLPHTEVFKKAGEEIVKFYDTEILTKKKDGSVVLRHGGYPTRGTRRRINQFLPDGIEVLSLKGTRGKGWVVRKGDEEIPFEDGMVLGGDGKPKRGGRKAQPEAEETTEPTAEKPKSRRKAKAAA